MEKFQIMGKKLERHGHILDFYTYELKVPNGNTAYWDVLEHKGASAIIPVDEDGNYRHQELSPGYKNALKFVNHCIQKEY